jgi:multiple sugar transport system substrate-binding protein
MNAPTKPSERTPVRLRGMTWSHPRGLDPLLATSEAFRDQGVSIEWDARSLQGFEEASIADLAAGYDLIAIDHPFMGKAFEQRALKALDDLFDPPWLDGLRRASVGPSFDSYRWEGSLWAIPVDAAAQVAAWRHDLLQTTGIAAPRSWNDVFALADALRGSGRFVALPANPTHVFLAWATICHALAGSHDRQPDLRPTWWTDAGIDPAIGTAALELLVRLLAVSHPLSWESDPIELFEHMAQNDDIVYTPIAFGYSNYARPPADRYPLRFAAVPSRDGGITGGMLGGVGLAVSHRCTNPAAAARFLRYVADAPAQCGLYASAGGQPGHRAAWSDARVDAICPYFFAPTLASLDVSFVRPRVPAYPRYQREGGLLLHARLRAGQDPATIVEDMNQLWNRM